MEIQYKLIFSDLKNEIVIRTSEEIHLWKSEVDEALQETFKSGSAWDLIKYLTDSLEYLGQNKNFDIYLSESLSSIKKFSIVFHLYDPYEDEVDDWELEYDVNLEFD